MRKTVSVTVALLLILSTLLLTACGGDNKTDLSDSKYVGSWKALSISVKEESEAVDGEWILTLNGDGTGQLVADDEEPTTFTWELTKDGFKTKGDAKLTFKDDGDNITTKIIGANLTFEKQ